MLLLLLFLAVYHVGASSLQWTGALGMHRALIGITVSVAQNTPDKGDRRISLRQVRRAQASVRCGRDDRHVTARTHQACSEPAP